MDKEVFDKYYEESEVTLGDTIISFQEDFNCKLTDEEIQYAIDKHGDDCDSLASLKEYINAKSYSHRYSIYQHDGHIIHARNVEVPARFSEDNIIHNYTMGSAEDFDAANILDENCSFTDDDAEWIDSCIFCYVPMEILDKSDEEVSQWCYDNQIDL